jgi:hypothetical protein
MRESLAKAAKGHAALAQSAAMNIRLGMKNTKPIY